jgi:hypothetical protein
MYIKTKRNQSSSLQYDDKKFHLLKWWYNGKDLIPQNGGEEFKSSCLQPWLPMLPLP